MASPQSDLAEDPIVDTHNPDHYKVGTLSYTKASLITLFLFLLWGDFCFCLMETVMPGAMSLKFNSLGAPNWALGLVLSTIPYLMTTIVNPVASFRSDRFRSKWGRRIPFLAGATPFVTIFLILLGYSEPISRFIQRSILGGKFSDLTVLIMVTGVLMVCFQFFNAFIQSVYYYLFNDVVPRAFLARFMSLFRIVGSCAGSLYGYFGFKYVTTYMQEIFIGASLLYLVGFGIMCWKVKEGDYPPPPQNLGNQHGLKAAIKTYAAECYTHRFYWFLFLANASWAMTWVSGPFGLLLSTKVMGFDLAFIGKVGAITGLIGILLLYPAGILADRFHPLRINLLGIMGTLIIAPLGILFPFMRDHFSLHTAKMISVTLSAINLPIGTIASAGEVALFMRLFPQDRYGQFCSANALIRSITLVFGGLACGIFLDYVKRFGARPDDCYRFVPVWNIVFHAGYVFFMYLLYREWKRLGGLKGYTPPSAKPSKRFTAILDRILGK